MRLGFVVFVAEKIDVHSTFVCNLACKLRHADSNNRNSESLSYVGHSRTCCCTKCFIICNFNVDTFKVSMLHPQIIGLLKGGGSKGRGFPNIP